MDFAADFGDEQMEEGEERAAAVPELEAISDDDLIEEMKKRGLSLDGKKEEEEEASEEDLPDDLDMEMSDESDEDDMFA